VVDEMAEGVSLKIKSGAPMGPDYFFRAPQSGIFCQKRSILLRFLNQAFWLVFTANGRFYVEIEKR
jgi:hypothetical protein